MIKIFGNIFLFLLLASTGFAQPFKLTDTSVKTGQFQHFYNIHFEFGSSKIKTTDFIQLDSILLFLKNNPAIKIEIGVHTDFRGNDNLNLELSKNRAINLKKYLIDNGINTNRITAIGFGETKPVIEFEDWNKILDTHRCGYYGRSNKRVTIVVI